jgi:hypothetical protein
MRIRFLLLLAVMLLIPITARAQKVTVDYAHGTNFSNYHTYAWMKGTPAKNPLVDQRIVQGIDSRLAAKGLQKVDNPETADLLVIYHAAVDTKTQLNTYQTGGWGGWGWGWGGPGYSSTTVQNIPVGQVIVDLADPKAKKFVWRGRGSETISSNPEKNAKKLDKALDKMFKDYPPGTKK